MRKGGAESSIDWLSSRFVGRKGKNGVTQYTHLYGTDLFVEKGKKLGGRVVCAGLDLLPSHRKKVQREQNTDMVLGYIFCITHLYVWMHMVLASPIELFCCC